MSLPANLPWTKLIGVFLIFCFLLFGIPVGLVRLFSHRLLDDRERLQVDARRTEFEAILAKAKLKSLKNTELLEYFSDVAFQIINRPGGMARVADWKARLNREFPGLLGFLLLGRDGKPVPGITDLELPEGMGQRLFPDLRRAQLGDFGPLTQRIAEYRAFFGPALGRKIKIKLVEEIERLDYLGKYRFGFFSTAFPEGVLIILLCDSPNWDLWIALHRVRQAVRENAGVRGAMVDIRRPASRWKKLFGRSWRALGSVLYDPRATDGSPVEAGGKLWTIRTLRGPWRLVFSYDLPPAPDIDLARRKIDAGCGVGFLFLCVAAWYMILGSGRTWLTIRFKLAALLLYVVAVPLLLLGGTARDLLRERRTILLQEERNRLERILQEFDRGFLIHLGRMVVDIRHTLEPPIDQDIDVLEQARERLIKLEKRYIPEISTLVDDRGKSRYSFKGKLEKTAKPLIVAVENAAGQLLAELNNRGGEAKRETARDQLIDVTGQMFGFNVKKIVGLVAQKIGHLETVFMGRENVHMTLQPVGTAGKTIPFLAILGWQESDLQPVYVSKIQHRFQRRLRGISLVTENISKERDELRGEFREARNTLRRRLEGEILPASIEFEENGRQFLMTGMRGSNLRRFRIYAVTDDSRVRAELSRLMVPYLALSLTLLAVAFGVAGVLTARFLAPVGNLMRGIEAIRDRRFDQPIPVVQRDELGHLSLAFNDMMEGMKELEVAKIVQDSLFPSKPLNSGSWNVCGTCRSASRVGGDYYDFFPLADGRIALIIGDVSGHGTSAALVVAMAKALITHPDTVFEPGPTLDLMQGVFFTTLQRKKMMSCFCAVFDPATGVLKSANAGHNLPFLVRGDGRVEQLAVGGKPLGTKNKPFVTQESRLEKGDWLFLYTDGFIEAQAIDAPCIGYERTEQALPTLRGDDAVDTHGRLREWQDRLSAPGPQADDITVVILQ